MGDEPFEVPEPGGTPVPSEGEQPAEPGAVGGATPPSVPATPGSSPWGWPAPPPGWAPPGWGAGPPGGPPPGWGPPPPWSAPGSWPGYPAPSGGQAGPPASSRRRTLSVVALVAGALLIAAAVSIPTAILVSRTGTSSPTSPSPTATPNPSQRAAAAQASALYQAMSRAAEKSAGFHYVVTSTGGGVTESTTGDAGQNVGSQVIEETTPYGHEDFDLLLTADQTVYFEGNTPALEDQLGVSASAAPALDGKWISVRVGDGPYRQLQVAITVDSQLQFDPLVPTSTQDVTGSGGVHLTRISGTVPAGQVAPDGGTAHFDVTPATDLPAAYVLSTSVGSIKETSTTTFSAWGKAPSITAPSSSVGWSTLPTSVPQGGYGEGEGPSPSPAATPTPTPGGGGSV